MSKDEKRRPGATSGSVVRTGDTLDICNLGKGGLGLDPGLAAAAC